MIALTRPLPPSIAACELTHLQREPIDVVRATEQHRAYERALEQLGCEVRRVDAAPQMPDSVFIEDTCVVVDELAVITRPGAASRRDETVAVERALAELRPIARIEAPGTLDGGDVLRVDRRVYVGNSGRTNEEGIRQLREHLAGYDVRSVAVRGCLHLKSAVTQVGERTLLLNPEWIDRELFADFDLIEVAEPFAANALLVNGKVLFPAAFPRTRERLERAGIEVITVEADEIAKAEGALTCCSVLVTPPNRMPR